MNLSSIKGKRNFHLITEVPVLSFLKLLSTTTSPATNIYNGFEALTAITMNSTLF
jgi:hypothetical protein